MLCFAGVPRQQSRTPTENARRSRTGVNSESNESAVNYLRTVRSSKLNQAHRLLGEEPQRLAIRHSPDLSRMPCRASSRENAAGYCIQSTGIGRTTQESQRPVSRVFNAFRAYIVAYVPLVRCMFVHIHVDVHVSLYRQQMHEHELMTAAAALCKARETTTNSGQPSSLCRIMYNVFSRSACTSRP